MTRHCHPILRLAIAMVIAILLPASSLAADASPAPDATGSPAATLAPADVVCDSVADLRLIVEFVRGTDVEQDGWVPVFVGVVAGLSEARQLAGSVAATYRPLLDDLIASLEAARATIDEVRDAETIGSGVAMIGTAITGIGNAMDALAVQLQTPCPTAAPSPVGSPSV